MAVVLCQACGCQAHRVTAGTGLGTLPHTPPALPCAAHCPALLPPTGHLCVWPQLQSIASRPHLLTVHDFEQEGSAELDTVILKALVKGEGGGQPPAEARGRQAWGMVCPLGGSVAFYCR